VKLTYQYYHSIQVLKVSVHSVGALALIFHGSQAAAMTVQDKKELFYRPHWLWVLAQTLLSHS
jgi:hypothetical protein